MSFQCVILFLTIPSKGPTYFMQIRPLCSSLSAFPLAFPHFSISLSHLCLCDSLTSIHLRPRPSFLSFPLFPLPPPFLAAVRLRPHSTSPPDKWGHCLAAGSGASRARLLRARSVERHQSPPRHFSILCLFFFFFLTYVFQLTHYSECRLEITGWLTSLFCSPGPNRLGLCVFAGL